MRYNDFDILFRSVHYSARLQITKIHNNAQITKWYLTRWVFEFSYKLYLTQNLQLFLDTHHQISLFPMSRYRIGHILSSNV